MNHRYVSGSFRFQIFMDDFPVNAPLALPCMFQLVFQLFQTVRANEHITEIHCKTFCLPDEACCRFSGTLIPNDGVFSGTTACDLLCEILKFLHIMIIFFNLAVLCKLKNRSGSHCKNRNRTDQPYTTDGTCLSERLSKLFHSSFLINLIPFCPQYAAMITAGMVMQSRL